MGTGWRGDLDLKMDRQKGVGMPMGHPLPTVLPASPRHTCPCHHAREGWLGKETKQGP